MQGWRHLHALPRCACPPPLLCTSPCAPLRISFCIYLEPCSTWRACCWWWPRAAWHPARSSRASARCAWAVGSRRHLMGGPASLPAAAPSNTSTPALCLQVTLLLVVNNALQGILSSFFYKYADTSESSAIPARTVTSLLANRLPPAPPQAPGCCPPPLAPTAPTPDRSLEEVQQHHCHHLHGWVEGGRSGWFRLVWCWHGLDFGGRR